MEIAHRGRVGPYQLFLASDTTISFAMGLFGPFWIVFVKDFGDSMSVFGYALALRMAAFSCAAWFGGGVSDRHGRRTVIVAGRLVSALIICSYLWTDSLPQLYALQICFGLAAAVDATAAAAFLGDITKRASRGRDVGRFTAATGMAAAVAMIIGGITVELFGIEPIFYAVAVLFSLSAALLLFVEEKREAE